jgi:hypothetical protein
VIKELLKELNTKYPPGYPKHHAITYDGASDELRLSIWINDLNHMFTLEDGDLNDIPKLIDAISHLLTHQL